MRKLPLWKPLAVDLSKQPAVAPNLQFPCVNILAEREAGNEASPAA